MSSTAAPPDLTHKASEIRPFLVSPTEAAALLGISERSFHSLRHAPWMPKPVQLGSRIVRYRVTELEAALQNAPRFAQQEPLHLMKARASARGASLVIQSPCGKPRTAPLHTPHSSRRRGRLHGI